MIAETRLIDGVWHVLGPDGWRPFKDGPLRPFLEAILSAWPDSTVVIKPHGETNNDGR